MTKEEIAELLGAEIVHDFHGDFISGVLFGIERMIKSRKRSAKMQKEWRIFSGATDLVTYDSYEEAKTKAEALLKDSPHKIYDIYELISTVTTEGPLNNLKIVWESNYPDQITPSGIIQHAEKNPAEQCIACPGSVRPTPRKMVILEGEHKGEIVDFMGIGTGKVLTVSCPLSCVFVEFDNGRIESYELHEVQFVKESANNV